MSSTQKLKEKILKEVTPPMDNDPKAKLSKFKVKENHFNKVKTYIDAKSKEVKTIEVDFINIHVGIPMVLYKDIALTTEQLSHFDEENKAYWLEAIK
jgi:hypothetical protein